jgi:hypothetical protein
VVASETGTRLEGVFWQIETPGRRVPGQLELSDGAVPALEVVGRIFDERAYRITISEHGGVTIAHSGNPDDLVADFQPRNINGELRDGRHVSLVEAQGGADPNSFMDLQYRQKFHARHAVMDEHVDGADQRYAAFKFGVRGVGWWQSADDEALTTDGSRLRPIWEEDSRSFEFSPNSPLTFREAESTVLNPIATLASLVTDNATDVGGLNVRIETGGPWRKVYSAEPPLGRASHPLLPSFHLRADRFASWIDLRKRTYGLDAAAIDVLDGIAVETEVLTRSAVAEGLHRKLFEDKKRVPPLSPNDLKHARRAARKAALSRVKDADRAGRAPLTDDDLTEFEKAMNDAFSFINEPTFKSRMTDLVEDSQSSIPNIVANFNDWPEAVKYARHTLAHEGTETSAELADYFVDLLIALKYSLPWVLRTVLLKRAGFDPATLQAAYADSSGYNHHITNTRYLLAGSPHAAKR